jgi:hypothetical protein
MRAGDDNARGHGVRLRHRRSVGRLRSGRSRLSRRRGSASRSSYGRRRDCDGSWSWRSPYRKGVRERRVASGHALQTPVNECIGTILDRRNRKAWTHNLTVGHVDRVEVAGCSRGSRSHEIRSKSREGIVALVDARIILGRNAKVVWIVVVVTECWGGATDLAGQPDRNKSAARHGEIGRMKV